MVLTGLTCLLIPSIQTSNMTKWITTVQGLSRSKRPRDQRRLLNLRMISCRKFSIPAIGDERRFHSETAVSNYRIVTESAETKTDEIQRERTLLNPTVVAAPIGGGCRFRRYSYDTSRPSIQRPGTEIGRGGVHREQPPNKAMKSDVE